MQAYRVDLFTLYFIEASPSNQPIVSLKSFPICFKRAPFFDPFHKPAIFPSLDLHTIVEKPVDIVRRRLSKGLLCVAPFRRGILLGRFHRAVPGSRLVKPFISTRSGLVDSLLPQCLNLRSTSLSIV